ncbi:MAG: ATPase domain-containing protein [Candidatus Thermoplasmatota archaeon]
MMQDRRETEVIVIFEALLSAYLGHVADQDALPLFRQKLKVMAKGNAAAGAVHLGEDGKVTIAPLSMNLQETIYNLGEVFDGLVEVSAFSKGFEEATVEAAAIAEEVLRRFGDRPEEMGIRAQILHGYLAPTTPLGIEGSDILLPSGVRKGSVMLLDGAPCKERDMIGQGLIIGGLERSEAAVLVLSSRSPGAIRKEISQQGCKFGMYEGRNLLKIVDWYTQRERHVSGIEEERSVIRSSKDLTNLAIAIDRAVQALEFAPSRRMLIEVIDSIEGASSHQPAVEFVQQVSAVLRDRRITAMWAVDMKRCPEKVASALRQSADGVLSIRDGADGGKDLVVRGFRDVPFSREPVRISVSKRGVRLESWVSGVEDIASELASVPGVEERHARALYEAGFQSVEQLERASIDSLVRVPGISETMASRIHDYLTSVEYAQQMLRRKSAVWVRMGKVRAAEGDKRRAVEAFKRGIEIMPENPEAWYELGSSLYEVGEREEAKRCFERAISLDPIYEGEWYGGEGYTPPARFYCSTCREEIDTEVTRCPSCGVILTLDERMRLGEILRTKR